MIHSKLVGDFVYLTKEPYKEFQQDTTYTGTFMLFSPSYGAVMKFAREGIESGLIKACKIKSRGFNVGLTYPLIIFAENTLIEPFLRTKVKEWNQNNELERNIAIERNFWKPNKQLAKIN